MLQNLADRASTVGELFSMLGHNHRWWIIPAVALLIVLGVVLVGLQAIPYVAPFIYTVL